MSREASLLKETIESESRCRGSWVDRYGEKYHLDARGERLPDAYPTIQDASSEPHRIDSHAG